jgi:hypothetical protein
MENEGVNVYVPRLLPDEDSRVCGLVERLSEDAPVRLVVGLLPSPAVSTPVDTETFPMAIVRAVVSTVPAALVGVVAEMLTLQAAPVPRASIAVHTDNALALTVWLLPVNVASAKATFEALTLSVPPPTVCVRVSAEACVTNNARLAPTQRMTTTVLRNVLPPSCARRRGQIPFLGVPIGIA